MINPEDAAVFRLFGLNRRSKQRAGKGQPHDSKRTPMAHSFLPFRGSSCRRERRPAHEREGSTTYSSVSARSSFFSGIERGYSRLNTIRSFVASSSRR